MCVVCAVSFFFLSYLGVNEDSAGFSCDSRMVKMSRRGRQSAIREIRSWSTEHLQNFLTDVSCTGRSLFVPPLFMTSHVIVEQLTERVYLFNERHGLES